MREKLVPSTWLEKEGRRLDCGPYLSGAVEAKVLVESLPVRRLSLREVTRGHSGGIYNGPQFVRNYVADPAYGVPFLTSSTMLLAEFTHVDLLKKTDATSPRLAYLRLETGMTLISCSGTIGRMAYARPEMDGMWSSQDVLKVVPDPDLVRPGYLYAFLSSRFGIPLIVGGTYGAIIPHLEPQHIADLPVPLAPESVQESVHALVEEAAELRTKASAELRKVIRELEEAAGLPPVDRTFDGASPDVSVVKAQALDGRMDGLFHSNYHRSVLDPLMALPAGRRRTVGEVATRVFWPAPFKRVRVESDRFGVPYFDTASLMRAEPEASYFIAKRTRNVDRLIADETSVLVPAYGQLNGIIGHAVLPYGDVIGAAVTHLAIRVVANDSSTAGYLFACLSSEYGRRQLKARAFGSSIPHLDEPCVAGTIIPILPQPTMQGIGKRAFAVARARHEAVIKEREARALVERWIEKKGNL